MSVVRLPEFECSGFAASDREGGVRSSAGMRVGLAAENEANAFCVGVRGGSVGGNGGQS